MALTRKFLKALGLEEEKIEQIIEAHSETVTGLTAEIEKHKANDGKLAELQKELENTKQKFDKFTPEKWAEFEAFNPSEIEELRKFKTDTETAQAFAKKETAAMKILSDKGFGEKAAKLILKAERENVDGIELDESGAAKNADKFFEPIGKSYADFATRTETGGALAGQPVAPTAQKPETLASAVAEKMGTLK